MKNLSGMCPSEERYGDNRRIALGGHKKIGQLKLKDIINVSLGHLALSYTYNKKFWSLIWMMEKDAEEKLKRVWYW